jgi:adenosylmethionine-8-amino-7-oxononanoate aminotransferase
VLEPVVQAAGGMLVAPEGYLGEVRASCDEYDVLLIADEVATGFGRTGKMFACEHEAVSPDIMAVAKSLTGGYLPLAATLTSERIYEAFLGDYSERKTFFHGHTYTGNPLACAAALANLEIFEKEKTIERLQPKIRHLEKRLSALSAHPNVGEVRQKGFMVGIELVKDRRYRTEFPWEEKIGIRVSIEARKRGLLTRPLGNVLVLVPPLSTTLAELDSMVDILHDSINAVLPAGNVK